MLEHPFNIGDKLCNAFSPEYDCIIVDVNKALTVTLIQGYPKIYIREALQPGESRLINMMMVLGVILIAFITKWYWTGYIDQLKDNN